MYILIIIILLITSLSVYIFIEKERSKLIGEGGVIYNNLGKGNYEIKIPEKTSLLKVKSINGQISYKRGTPCVIRKYEKRIYYIS